MSDTQVEDTGSILEGVMSSEPKLWAGKFKNPEDLEEAYKNSAKVFNENKKLHDDLASHIKVPDDYIVPEGLSLREVQIRDLKNLAKRSGLNQNHFENFAKVTDESLKQNMESLEKAKESVGKEKLSLLDDYISKNYPESLHQTILNKLIKDDTAMNDALRHRDQLLNSQVAGISNAVPKVGDTYDGYKELERARADFMLNKSDERARDRYFELAKEIGHARAEKRSR